MILLNLLIKQIPMLNLKNSWFYTLFIICVVLSNCTTDNSSEKGSLPYDGQHDYEEKIIDGKT